MSARPISPGVKLLALIVSISTAVVMAFAAAALTGALSVLMWITFGLHVFGTYSRLADES